LPALQLSAVIGDPGSIFEIQPAAAGQAVEKLQATEGAYPSLKALMNDPATQGIWAVNVHPAAISSDNRVLSVSIPGGKSVRFDLRRFSETAGMPGWVGDNAATREQGSNSPEKVAFDPLTWISLVRDGDQVVGDIHVDGQLYQLHPVGTGKHVLVKVDETKMPPEAEPLLSSGGEQREAEGEVGHAQHSTIRVLLVSTNQRRELMPHYRAEMIKALQNANQALINSRVDITYELAGFFDPDYDEGDRSYAGQLSEVSNLAAPLGKEVNIQREALGADLVSMYITMNQFCGMAYGWSTKEKGYNVVSCAGSLAHELGHNVGARDGWNPDPPPGNSQGYKHETYPVFHTIMVTSHGAIPYFSNPRVQYQGLPVGTARHDVSDEFNRQREKVENFYPSPHNYLPIRSRAKALALQGECLQADEVTGAVVVSHCPRDVSGEVNALAEWKLVKSGEYYYIMNHRKDNIDQPAQCLRSFSQDNHVEMGVCKANGDRQDLTSMRQWRLNATTGNYHQLQNVYQTEGDRTQCLFVEDDSSAVSIQPCTPASQADWQWEQSH
jgi:hypothetical protein